MAPIVKLTSAGIYNAHRNAYIINTTVHSSSNTYISLDGGSFVGPVYRGSFTGTMEFQAGHHIYCARNDSGTTCVEIEIIDGEATSSYPLGQTPEPNIDLYPKFPEMLGLLDSKKIIPTILIITVVMLLFMRK